MKLKFFSYTAGGGIMVSLQLSSDTAPHWDDCPATIHECKDLIQACSIAQAISNVTGRAVRFTVVRNSYISQTGVGKGNGTYFVPSAMVSSI